MAFQHLLYGHKIGDTTFKNSDIWYRGKNPIPERFTRGFAIAVKSKQEIWLIGGKWTSNKIFTFNIENHIFMELPTKLIKRRAGLRCALIPNTSKIIVTGGIFRGEIENSTEIIDTEDGSVILASPMNLKRYNHGIGLFEINGKNRLVVFGGNDTDTFEFYNAESNTWHNTDMKLSQPKNNFGFLSVKLSEVIQKPKC